MTLHVQRRRRQTTTAVITTASATVGHIQPQPPTAAVPSPERVGAATAGLPPLAAFKPGAVSPSCASAAGDTELLREVFCGGTRLVEVAAAGVGLTCGVAGVRAGAGAAGEAAGAGAGAGEGAGDAAFGVVPALVLATAAVPTSLGTPRRCSQGTHVSDS